MHGLRGIDENGNAHEAIQTRIDATEHNKNSSSSGSRKENEQNSVRAAATGFAESSTEEEVREFFTRSDEETRNGRNS